MASGQKRCTITGDRYNTAPMEYLLVGRRATAARHLPGFTKKYTQTPSGLDFFTGRGGYSFSIRGAMISISTPKGGGSFSTFFI